MTDFVSREPERRLVWQFSLRALLVVMTVACLALGLWSDTRRYRVTAYLEFTSYQQSPFYNAKPQRPVSRRDIDRAVRNELSLAKSQRVLASAVDSYRGASATSITDEIGQDDAIAQLYDRLSVSFAGDSRIMEMKIEGRGLDSGEDVKVLQAVVDAYVESSTTSQIRVMQQPKLVRQ